MKELKKIIHPLTLVIIPVLLFIMFLLWMLIASKSYDIQAGIVKEKMLGRNNSENYEREIDSILETIKNKKQKIGEGSELPTVEIRYILARSFPFPQEVISSYKRFQKQHERYLSNKEKNGKPTFMSFFESLNITKKNIILVWIISIFLGSIIGYAISLHPSTLQSIGWFFKLFLATSPIFLSVIVGLIVFSPENQETDFSTPTFYWSTILYTTMLISYFVAHRNSHSAKDTSTNNKNFYYALGLENVFNGFKLSLCLLAPLSISIELLTQKLGVGLTAWDIYNSGTYHSNSEMILLCLLVSLFVIKIDLVLLAIQHGVKIMASKKELASASS